jgi:CysZ protein
VEVHRVSTALLPDVASGSVFARFSSGASFAASGIGFTLRHRRLVLLSLVPMVVQVALFVALLVLGLGFVDDAVARFGPEPGHWYSFLGSVLGAALVLGVIVLSVIGSLFIGSVVCDPFYDLLSEATESLTLGRSVGGPLSPIGAIKGILLELGALPSRLIVYLSVAFPLWLLGLTGAGSVVAVPASLAWTWLFVALSLLSRSMGRHAVPGRARLAALFSQKACSLGLGAVGWALAHVPLTAPFLVVGGTRLYLALAAWDRIPSNLSDDDKRALRGGPGAP